MYPSIEDSVANIMGTSWNITKGTVVPKTEDVVLKNGGKLVEAVYLYADLAGSSKLAQSLKKEATAKIIKAYISTASRIILYKDGEIRSFDGDRVMGIFMGADKEQRAVRAAMGIHWAVCEVIRPAIKTAFTDGEDFCNVQHAIGIDAGEALIVRGGVRDNNDLISIGSAPNVAAKLSDIRTSHSLFITKAVYDELGDEYLTYEAGRRNVWTRTLSPTTIGGKSVSVYSSSVYWAV
ncbi:adenylate/guanylate cyclase domain-containing protein [Actinotalea ferrariae]|uniref:adenylate/guanylate cyclase domain-containing protein n=1 Tax=Actinotalea ferrariae TaxID=1386098 RepID=UPI001C8B244D|nr:adenylate/guanylate cyclase domain-containing protein [Actinotalea ferrariae]MBX9243577.1 adenylate/guanylate cyclase domain-containing protein [Actinotalea ferrariae]